MWNPAPLHGFNVVSAILCPAQSSIINKVNSRQCTQTPTKRALKGIKIKLKFPIKSLRTKDLKVRVCKNADESKIRRKPHAPPPARLELLIKKQLLRSTSTFVYNPRAYIHVHSHTSTYNQRMFRFISTSLRVSQLTFYALRVPTFLPGRVHRAKTWSLSKTTNNCRALSNVWQMDSVGR